MDKDLANRLLDIIENLQIENRAYRALLDELQPSLPTETMVKRLLWARQEEARDQLQTTFAALREKVQQSHDQEQAFREMLRVLPAKKDEN